MLVQILKKFSLVVGLMLLLSVGGFAQTQINYQLQLKNFPSACGANQVATQIGLTPGCTTLTVNFFNSGTGASSSTFLRGDGTWAVPPGTGNTTSTSLTSGFYPKANGANSIINGSCDSGITTASTFTCSDTAGASFVKLTTVGTGAGLDALVGAATNPAIPANSVGWLAPSSASFTAYALQFPTTNPTNTNNTLQCGTPASNISTCSWAAAGSCPTCVVASSPGAGIAHFAGG